MVQQKQDLTVTQLIPSPFFFGPCAQRTDGRGRGRDIRRRQSLLRVSNYTSPLDDPLVSLVVSKALGKKNETRGTQPNLLRGGRVTLTTLKIDAIRLCLLADLCLT